MRIFNGINGLPPCIYYWAGPGSMIELYELAQIFAFIDMVGEEGRQFPISVIVVRDDVVTIAILQ